jgi:D-alanyl-lipoteichoic acid acyltransferase DltB (MBOAT superfamily)
MQFNSYLYVFVFLPLVWGLYTLFRTRPAAKWILLLASCFFYGFFAPVFLIPLLVSGVVDYYIGVRLAGGSDRVRKLLLIASCALNLGMLAVFKYTNWLTRLLQPVGEYFGVSIPTTDIPLPPGISFYTFQTLCYVIAVYQMQFAPTRRFIDYMNYIMFFPQLVAGPIERAQNLLPQLSGVRPMVSARDASGGLFLILFGLFKKLVLADNFGGIVEFVTQAMPVAGGQPVPGLGLLFAYAFAGQIYCDFSSYSDIAIGSAMLFNVNLMRNFATPYLSVNPAQFWAGWHISLTTWLREFLFTPLCFWMAGDGRRGRTVHVLLAMFLTMVLCGLWHGAGVMFLLWGAFHGALYAGYVLCPVDRYLRRGLGRVVGSAVAWVLFLHLICFSWILFRCTSLEHFGLILRSIAQVPQMLDSPLSPQWIGQNYLFYALAWGLLLLAAVTLIGDLVEKLSGGDVRRLFLRLPAPAGALGILGLFYGITFFGRRVGNEFIYFAF